MKTLTFTVWYDGDNEDEASDVAEIEADSPERAVEEHAISTEQEPTGMPFPYYVKLPDGHVERYDVTARVETIYDVKRVSRR